MATLLRHKTKYPGVYFIIGESTSKGGREKIYYIRYRRDSKQIEEKAGRQFVDDMTPAKAAIIRVQKITGKKPSRKAAREEARKKIWTIDTLWNEYKKQKPDNKTLKVDDNRYQNYVKPVIGNKQPSNLVPLDIDRIRIRLLKTKSPQTVRHVLGIIKRIANFGHNKGLAPGTNFKIEMPEVDNTTTEDLTPKQLSDLLKAIEVDQNTDVAALMKMALFTGLRRGELFKLQWSDIDFHRGFILVRDPKGGKDQQIPLNDNTRELLSNHQKTKSPYVFPGRDGGQRVCAAKAVNRIKKAAGLPKNFRPLHGLRHVYASILASSGQVDMYTLQRLLTHKNPTMTQRYAHLRDEALKKASDLAGDIIEQAANKRKVINININKISK